MSLEVEVKFAVADVAEVRGHLVRMGAVLVTPRLYERNVIYDTADQALRHAQKLLRLRWDERVRLTVKAPAPEADAASQAKVRQELEIVVSEGETAEAILHALGFTPQLIYEKYRETYQWGQVEVVLDELPYGHFVELEGGEGEMRPLATALGLAWERRLLTNYLAMMGELRQQYQLPFTDITFANFTGAYAVRWEDRDESRE